MKVYAVGGAVRDGLMGHEAHDRDWVVVGSTPEQMAAKGYLPVGRDFPVFLHPDTHEEYALARAEKKVAVGHGGFQFFCSPEITLEEDLSRRDLTVNAMAREMDADGGWTGALVDPFGGEHDLRAKILRHVGPAFAEDPLRVLRVGRFCARWPEFSIAPETLELCRQIAQSRELESLSAERVWQEVSRGLMSEKPSRMLQALRDANAWEKIGAPIAALWSPSRDRAAARAMAVCDLASARGLPLSSRYALLALESCCANPLGETPDPAAAALQKSLATRWKTPSECSDLARLIAQEARAFKSADTAPSVQIARLLERADALRKPDRLSEALAAWATREAALEGREAEARARRGAERIAKALAASRAVNAGAVAALWEKEPSRIRGAVQEAREEAVANALDEESKPAQKARGPR